MQRICRMCLCLTVAAMVAFSAQLCAQSAYKKAEEKPPDWLYASDQDLQWWRQARFGMFIHWGPVCLKGKEISWSRGDRGPRKSGGGPIPVEVYDNLYKRFNPKQYAPEKWVEIAKGAGMKYIVFTTKHHAGYCMFDSKLTEYDIMSSPYGRDIVGRLAKACHENDMRLGFYYSPPDWHHPDYRAENHDAYIDYLHGQLQELCSNYGRVDILWFDGLGGSAEDWQSEKMFKMIRKLQPHILINNRGGLRGDFDTPEQTIGRFRKDRPWESCITIGRQWAWRPNDNIKSKKKLIHTLIRCAGGDGNLLLNVGPRPDGRIAPRQAQRLRQTGDWLDKYGKAIYGTRGGPFLPETYGASTYFKNTIFVHVLNWTQQPLPLPPIDRKVISARVLTGGTVDVSQSAQRLELSVPENDRHSIDTIVALKVDGPVADIEPTSLPSGSVAFDRLATASNTFRGSERYGPDKAIDDDPRTRWATDWGTHEASLEVDPGEPQKIGRAFISEACGERVRSFKLQRMMDDGAWKTFAEGTRIGERLRLKFEPVTAKRVRLKIEEATEGPTIWEFQLFSP